MNIVRFENCIPVKGHTRSAICDIQRHEVKLIPNDLYIILTELNGKSIDEIKSKYDEADHETIDEYILFLLENDFIFLTNKPQWYPKISKDWQHSSSITNAIADINKESSYDLRKFIYELHDLGCVSLELRFFDLVNVKYLEELLEFMQADRLHMNGVECYIKYSKFYEEKKLIELIDRYSRLMKLTVHSADENRVINSKVNDLAYLVYTTQFINSASHCGIIHKDYFTVNLSAFTESLHHNSCLNRKISIDVDGNIKNCPSMTQSFGNIKETTLSEVLQHKEFKKYWNVTKDYIKVCKDCEFRHICTDCRAFTENPEDNYSKPLKCGYNPYTNEWSEWSTNPLKQKAITYYEVEIQ